MTKRLTPAMVVAMIALLAAVGGTAGVAQAAAKKPVPRWTEATADARMDAYAKAISPVKEGTLWGERDYKFVPKAGCFSSYSRRGSGRVRVRPGVWAKTYDLFHCVVYVLIPKTPESEYDESWEGVNVDVRLKVTGKRTFRFLSCEVEEARHVGLVPRCEKTVIR
jgi:hypothetical protein